MGNRASADGGRAKFGRRPLRWDAVSRFGLRYNLSGAGSKVCGDVRGVVWGVAKWQGTGFWSRHRRFESCRPSWIVGDVVVRSF